MAFNGSEAVRQAQLELHFARRELQRCVNNIVFANVQQQIALNAALTNLNAIQTAIGEPKLDPGTEDV
jgi:hypothetical protein